MNTPLILNQTGFVLANARALARLSRQVYSVPRSAAIYDASTDTVCEITRFDDGIVITFRGTADIRNWITDAEFEFEAIDGGRVHRGGWQAINSVLALIKETLGYSDVFHYQDCLPLTINGHSLGGLLAIYAAWLLAGLGFPIHSVYTFGQPRAGDLDFAEAYDGCLGSRTFRTVNQNDLVPRLPGVLLGYRHSGQLSFISKEGVLLENPSELTVEMDTAIELFEATGELREVLIHDHFADAYVAALEKV